MLGCSRFSRSPSSPGLTSRSPGMQKSSCALILIHPAYPNIHVPFSYPSSSCYPGWFPLLVINDLPFLQRHFMSSEAGRSPDVPAHLQEYQFPLGSSGTWSPSTMHTLAVLTAHQGGWWASGGNGRSESLSSQDL